MNKKNYKPISLVNIGVKILNKNACKLNQKYIEKIIHHDQNVSS